MVCFNHNDFICEEIDDSSVILKISTQDVFLLNVTSNYIFNELLRQKSIEIIINEYWHKKQYANYDTIHKDFIGIRNTLFEKGILYEH